MARIRFPAAIIFTVTFIPAVEQNHSNLPVTQNLHSEVKVAKMEASPKA
jgi:hypothetical protein